MLDFIEFLKVKQRQMEEASPPKTAEKIEAFFRSLKIDTRGFKYGRDEANARKVFIDTNSQL